MEAETANYWRFRHDKFRRGRPELLLEIKRTNTPNSKEVKQTKSNDRKADVAAPSSPAVASSSSEEVQVLKKRIEEMTKNIDNLTAMVQKVTLKQTQTDEVQQQQQVQLQQMPRPPQHYAPSVQLQDSVMVGKKRKTTIPPTRLLQEEDDDDVVLRPDVTPSIGWINDVPLAASQATLEAAAAIAPPVTLPDPMPSSSLRLSSLSTTSSADSEFVDKLFTAFADEDMFAAEDETMDTTTKSSSEVSDASVSLRLLGEIEKEDEASKNRPDPELMQRLSDALMLLPKEIQEMIVNRLIESITSTELPVLSVAHAAKTEDDDKEATEDVDDESMEVVSVQTKDEKTSAPLPLAAATLAALLHHYSAQVAVKHGGKNVAKSIPVIPVHA